MEYDCSFMGVFASDIIRLSDINEKFGYMAGNARLKMVADVIRGVFTGYDIYRYEQDEIVVFCKDIDKKSFMGLVRIVRESLDDLDVSVSTGFSWTDKPDIARQLSEVRLMYDIEKDAKLKSLDSIMRNKVFKDVVSEIEKGSFMVYYQPKVDIRTGQIVGTEALARWIHNGEVIQPFRFIPTMERNGFIIHLDLYILKRVCEAINEWIEKGYKLVPISVNISRNDISGVGHDPRMLAERIIRIIKEYDIDPKYIIIEVTETTEASEQKDLYDFIKNMSEAGIATSIDDFGTGCSTLSVLRDFPVNEIKIDRSFINHEAFSTQDQIIIKSIIQMARQLNLNVITEGVETEEQARFLLELGCNHAQGYLYDKPLEQSAFESRLSVGGYDRKI